MPPLLRLFDGSQDTSPELQDDVKHLQTDLNQHGFGLTVDGVFGNATEASVRQFQLDSNLQSDGVVGPATWAALLGQEPPDLINSYPTTISSGNAAMMAQIVEANKYKDFIEAGATSSGFDAVVIAAIGSRESGWGLLLQPQGPNGTGDFAKRNFPTAFRNGPLPDDGGFGRGLMQIDFDAFPFARSGGWQDPQQNIAFGCNVLRSSYVLLQTKTSLQGRDLVQAAIAGYNCGPGNVLQAIRDGRNTDFYTTGRNYSADVLNRAGFFQAQRW